MPNEENKGSRRKNGRARARRRKELEEDEEVELNGYRGKWEKGGSKFYFQFSSVFPLSLSVCGAGSSRT